MSLIHAVHVERISKLEHNPIFIGAPVALLSIAMHWKTYQAWQSACTDPGARTEIGWRAVDAHA